MHLSVFAQVCTIPSPFQIETKPKDVKPIISPQNTTDRFNFASFDCGALVLGTNPEAKQATAILIKSKDQYMLNPCAAKKYIEVELCEEILVDTIQLANLEFFSSVFKKIKVLTTTRYPSTWQLVGEFTAQNSRKLQSFVIDEHQRGWSKYVRIEFDSHYGSEFYCPLTTLKVLGTSMVEDMKRVEAEPSPTIVQIPVSVPSLIETVQLQEITTESPTPTPINEKDSIFKSILKRLSNLEKNTTSQKQLDEVKEQVLGQVKISFDSLDSKWNTISQDIDKALQSHLKQYHHAVQEQLSRLSKKEEQMNQILSDLKDEMSWTHFWNQIHLVVSVFALKALLDQFGGWITWKSKPLVQTVSTNTERSKKRRRSH
ncbi:UNC-like C-terminal-domain-containing protein [Gorgonomyces haynaldii]|nr:UNC-like C-terminal-domain-containing protein [Gorgonomyces haynaldii]